MSAKEESAAAEGKIEDLPKQDKDVLEGKSCKLISPSASDCQDLTTCKIRVCSDQTTLLPGIVKHRPESLKKTETVVKNSLPSKEEIEAEKKEQEEEKK